MPQPNSTCRWTHPNGFINDNAIRWNFQIPRALCRRHHRFRQNFYWKSQYQCNNIWRANINPEGNWWARWVYCLSAFENKFRWIWVASWKDGVGKFKSREFKWELAIIWECLCFTLGMEVKELRGGFRKMDSRIKTLESTLFEQTTGKLNFSIKVFS